MMWGQRGPLLLLQDCHTVTTTIRLLQSSPDRKWKCPGYLGSETDQTPKWGVSALSRPPAAPRMLRVPPLLPVPMPPLSPPPQPRLLAHRSSRGPGRGSATQNAERTS